MTPDLTRTHDLVDRLYRLNAAGDWADTLNPTQRMALAYLARANRFSRCPSHVAEYMALTRGTASQTLKALVRKKLIRSQRSSKDGRSISYQVTEQGLHVLGRSCRHHKKTDLGGHCGLLNEPLHAGEELQICREFAEKAPGMDTVGD